MTRAKYVVSAPTYNPMSGGTLFQHQLVHTLNELGETAFIWQQPPVAPLRGLRRASKLLKHRLEYKTNPNLNTPIANLSKLGRDFIAVYPEIVLGNPLSAQHVARWLLYKPGIRHPYEFTKGEIFFRAFEKADVKEITGSAHELHLWQVNKVYRNENRNNRSGLCYAVRKGDKKRRIPETEDSNAICIDGLDHEKINRIFNSCSVFVSYDEATMFSQYAAVCGCLSVIVPGDHKNRAELVEQHELYRVGVAYGFDDAELQHAKSTRSQVLSMLEEKERQGIETVKNFIHLTQEYASERKGG